VWIFKYAGCLIQGHEYIDLTGGRYPYQYCLHCGKIKEPLAVVKNRRPRLVHVN
jgi:hypothetical protein